MDENLPLEQPEPMEEPAAPEETYIEESSLPDDFTPLGGIDHLPRARRRRAQRMLVPPGADERAALLDSLSRRAFPTIEFFLFAILCGAVLGAAYLMDSPAFLLLGVLLAPLLTPWVGLTLATLTGSWRFFFLTFGGLLVASVLVFLTGALAGLAGRLWLPRPLVYADTHSHLWWQDLVVVTLGAVLLVISFVRSEQKPLLPSLMLAYGLFLPLSAGGVGLGIQAAHIWPDGVLVFLAHLALATLVGCIVLAILKFKPLNAFGYLLPISIILASMTGVFFLFGLDSLIREGITATRHTAAPTPTVLSLPSLTPVSSAFATLTPTSTPAVTDTPQPSPTAQATPSFAVITSPSGGGALVRTEAGGGTVVTALINGTLVQVLPDIQVVGSANWVHVRLANNLEGWVLQTVLTATTMTPTTPATPSPSRTP
ncbi:MAG TPA: SH3 domain-containing protein [Anaerolineales bacterium]|nr:SH3 domain-containing protein [Anaerolineales bacterium]